MPPLPNVSLSQEFTTTLSGLARRKKDLTEYQIPRLRDCKGPLSLQQQLAAELREDVDAFRRSVEELENLAEEHERDRERREARGHVEEYAGVLATLKRETRAALLKSKQTIDMQNRTNREELLQSSVMRETQSGKPSDDALLNASNKVTEALRRTTLLMQAELERSVLSAQMLESSTANLRSASSAHDVLSSVMSTSKQLITALEKSDWLDRFIIFAALAFFFLVCGFILKQRIVDRSVRVLFWWTRFLPDFAGETAELERLERGGIVLETVATASISLAVPTLSVVAASVGSSIDKTLSSLALETTAIPLPVESAVDQAIHSLIDKEPVIIRDEL